MPATKTCQYCGEPIYGRSDKRFCDDHCRTGFNNHQNGDTTLMRNVNNVLRKNRKIIQDLLPPDELHVQTSFNELVEKGFNFDFYTHIFKTKAGSEYKYVYEYGYQHLENNTYILVKQPKHDGMESELLPNKATSQA